MSIVYLPSYCYTSEHSGFSQLVLPELPETIPLAKFVQQPPLPSWLPSRSVLARYCLQLTER